MLWESERTMIDRVGVKVSAATLLVNEPFCPAGGPVLKFLLTVHMVGLADTDRATIAW